TADARGPRPIDDPAVIGNRTRDRLLRLHFLLRPLHDRRRQRRRHSSRRGWHESEHGGRGTGAVLRILAGRQVSLPLRQERRPGHRPAAVGQILTPTPTPTPTVNLFIWSFVHLVISLLCQIR